MTIASRQPRETTRTTTTTRRVVEKVSASSVAATTTSAPAPPPALSPPARAKRTKPQTLLFGGEVLHLPGFLSPRDLRALEEYLSSHEVQSKLSDAVMHDSARAQYRSRRCASAWLPLATLPAGRRFRAAVKMAQDAFETLPRAKNGAHRCVYEDVQYSEYSGAVGGHFQQWHLDADEGGLDDEDGRELTLVALLTTPGVDFDGGDFEVMLPRHPDGVAERVDWTKGDLIAFRAKHLWHRVLPCSSGDRKSLVLWAKDPAHKPQVLPPHAATAD